MTGALYALVAHASSADLLASAEPFFAHSDPDVEAIRSNVYGFACADRADPDEHDLPARTWSVRDNEARVVGACFWRPPRPLVVGDLPLDAASSVLDGLQELFRPGASPRPDGLSGPAATVDALQAARRSRGEAPLLTRHRLLLYRCDALSPPPPIDGRLRQAHAGDRERCLDWMQAFLAETGMGPRDAPRPSAFPHLDAGRLFLWEVDGEPVASACWTRPTPHAAAIGFVYVPPALRGRHYASAVTAGLTTHLFEVHGKRFTTLFTDVENPASNHVYRKLGYRAVAPFVDVGSPPADG